MFRVQLPCLSTKSMLPLVLNMCTCVFAMRGHVVMAGCAWQPYSSAPYLNPAFPETNATYLRIGFQRGAPGNETLARVRGKIDGSRYVSFTIYNPVTNDAVAHVSDQDMLLTNSSYDIVMGSTVALEIARHVLARDGESLDGINFVAVNDSSAFYGHGRHRHAYFPLFEIWHRNYLGAVEGETLPSVEFMSVRTSGNETGHPSLEEAQCPGPLSGVGFPTGAASRIPPMNHRHEMMFFRSRGDMLYPNPDNLYLASRINPRAGNVATISFRPPPPGSMRYWSICLGGLNTTTSGCLYDRQILDANGLDQDAVHNPGTRVRVMFGPEGWRDYAARSGMAFIPWGLHRREFIIYRNMLTVDSHPGSLAKVPPLQRGHLIPCRVFCRNWDRISAEKFIGDWAPTGWQQ